MDPIEKAARDIKERTQAIYVPRHEYRRVDAKDFRHLDLKFYDRVRDALTAQGCLCFGDFENVTLKGGVNDFRTFIRMLVSEDRTVSIGLFHPKPKFWVRCLLWLLRIKLGRIMDCETELSNGGYIVTSNATEAAKLNPPPGFDQSFLPLNTPHNTIYETHRQRLRAFLSANPDVRATALNTPEEALDMQHRMQNVKAAYRASVGYATEDELKRMGADSEMAAQVKQAMTRSDNSRPPSQ
jgi:hypothetical protein